MHLKILADTSDLLSLVSLGCTLLHQRAHPTLTAVRVCSFVEGERREEKGKWASELQGDGVHHGHYIWPHTTQDRTRLHTHTNLDSAQHDHSRSYSVYLLTLLTLLNCQLITPTATRLHPVTTRG